MRGENSFHPAFGFKLNLKFKFYKQGCYDYHAKGSRCWQYTVVLRGNKEMLGARGEYFEPKLGFEKSTPIMQNKKKIVFF